VDWFRIDKAKNDKKSLCEEINGKLFEHIMTGIEVFVMMVLIVMIYVPVQVISGKHGQFYARNRFNHFDKKVSYHLYPFICF
jgi:hypothetical protein